MLEKSLSDLLLEVSNWYIFNNHYYDLLPEAQEECAIGAFEEILCGFPIYDKEKDVFRLEQKLAALEKINEAFPAITEKLEKNIFDKMEKTFQDRGYFLSIEELLCFDKYLQKQFSLQDRWDIEKRMFKNFLLYGLEHGLGFFRKLQDFDAFGPLEEHALPFDQKVECVKELVEYIKRRGIIFSKSSTQFWGFLVFLADEYLNDEKNQYLRAEIVFLNLLYNPDLKNSLFKKDEKDSLLILIRGIYNSYSRHHYNFVWKAIVHYCAYMNLPLAEMIAEKFFIGDSVFGVEGTEYFNDDSFVKGDVIVSEIKALQKVEAQIRLARRPGNPFDDYLAVAGVEDSFLVNQVIAYLVEKGDYWGADYMARLYLSEAAYEKIRPQLEAIQIK